MTIPAAVPGAADSIGFGRLLAEYFRAGNEPEAIASPVRLREQEGEALYFQTGADLLQWAEGTFTARGRDYAPVFGGSKAAVVAGLVGSAIATHRLQRKVDRLNAPSWRLISSGTVFLTSQRFLLHIGGTWQDIDFRSVLGAQCDGVSLVLTIPGMPPTALRVPFPHYLFVLYEKVANGELVFV